MIYYSTGKGTYKRGAIGVAVEVDEATAKVLIKKGYLTDGKAEVKESKVENSETVETVEEKSLNINTNTRFNDGSFIEKKKVVKSKGRPKKK